MVIGIDYPNTHNGPSIHNANMWPALCLLVSTPEVHGRASAGIDVLESSSLLFLLLKTFLCSPVTQKTKGASGPKLCTLVGHVTRMKIHYYFGPQNESQGPRGPNSNFLCPPRTLKSKVASGPKFAHLWGMLQGLKLTAILAPKTKVRGPRGPNANFFAPLVLQKLK